MRLFHACLESNSVHQSVFGELQRYLQAQGRQDFHCRLELNSSTFKLNFSTLATGFETPFASSSMRPFRTQVKKEPPLSPGPTREARDGITFEEARSRWHRMAPSSTEMPPAPSLVSTLPNEPTPDAKGTEQPPSLESTVPAELSPASKRGSSWNDISDEARYNAAFHQFKQNKGYRSFKTKRTKRLTLPSRCRFGWRRKGVVTEPTSMHV